MFQIIREKLFDSQVTELSKTYNRYMDDLDSAIDWALCNHPDRIPNLYVYTGQYAGYYLWCTDEFAQNLIPIVWILYRIDFTINTVYLISITEEKSI